MTDLIKEQGPPGPSSGDCWLLVMADMEARRAHGIEKYGRPVQPDNGRDALVDAYQEALDLCVYLRQEIEEGWRGRALAAEIEVRDLRARLESFHASAGPVAFSPAAMRLERERANLSQREAGAAAGVTHSTVGNWESGRTEPTAGQVAMLASAFRVPLHLLFVGAPEAPDGDVPLGSQEAQRRPPCE